MLENVAELIAGALDFDAEVMEDWEQGERDRFTELDLFLQQVALVPTWTGSIPTPTRSR